MDEVQNKQEKLEEEEVLLQPERSDLDRPLIPEKMQNGNGMPKSTAKRDAFIILAVVLFFFVLIIFGKPSSEKNTSENLLSDKGSSSGTSTPTGTSTPREPQRSFISNTQRLAAPSIFTSPGSRTFSGSRSSQDDSVLKSVFNTSFYEGFFRLRDGVVSDAIYPGREYISIDVTQKNLSFIHISDWTLESKEGVRVRLGEASFIPSSSEPNRVSPVFVSGDEKIIVSSGSSPLGVSFRENKCIGYLEQFRDFFPPLEQRCPSPSREPEVMDFSRECRSFIREIPMCRTNTRHIPNDLNSTCRNFINTEINYDSCVDSHKHDKDFYTGKWRLFLNQPDDIWDTNDEIILRDSSGKVVDVLEI